MNDSCMLLKDYVLCNNGLGVTLHVRGTLLLNKFPLSSLNKNVQLNLFDEKMLMINTT